MAIFAQPQQQQTFAFACRRGTKNTADWPRNDIRVTAENGALKVVTPYSAAFVVILIAALSYIRFDFLWLFGSSLIVFTCSFCSFVHNVHANEQMNTVNKMNITGYL